MHIPLFFGCVLTILKRFRYVYAILFLRCLLTFLIFFIISLQFSFSDVFSHFKNVFILALFYFSIIFYFFSKFFLVITILLFFFLIFSHFFKTFLWCLYYSVFLMSFHIFKFFFWCLLKFKKYYSTGTTLFSNIFLFSKNLFIIHILLFFLMSPSIYKMSLLYLYCSVFLVSGHILKMLILAMIGKVAISFLQ